MLEVLFKIGDIHPQQEKAAVYLGKVFIDKCLFTVAYRLLQRSVGNKKADAPLVEDDLLLLQELINQFTPFFEARSLKIQVDIQPGVTILANRMLADILLGNLLTNALKYSSRKENPATFAPDK